MSQKYDFKALKSYKTSFELLKGIIFLIVVAFVIAIVGLFIIYSKNVTESNDKIYVMDNNGLVYPAQVVKNETLYDKQVQYFNHVKTFVLLWYAFDENNYDENISQGLYLLGDCGKDLKDFYDANDVKDQILKKNLRYTAKVIDVQFDWNARPVSGIATVEQTVIRGTNSQNRTFNASFVILDDGINRSFENPFGLKIEKWKIIKN